MSQPWGYLRCLCGHMGGRETGIGRRCRGERFVECPRAPRPLLNCSVATQSRTKQNRTRLPSLTTRSYTDRMRAAASTIARAFHEVRGEMVYSQIFATEHVEAAVRRAAERHALWRPGVPLVVGVSGGPDSLCLLGALLALRDRGGPVAPGELIVAHLDHGLRGSEGRRDAEW